VLFLLLILGVWLKETDVFDFKLGFSMLRFFLGQILRSCGLEPDEIIKQKHAKTDETKGLTLNRK